jgi:nucleotide-binding universal stress UspA family protein
MTVEASSISNNHSNISIRKILVPIDGSEYSLKAAKYAVRIAKDENAQLFRIHCIVGIPYGYINPASSTDQYYEDIKDKVESWFDEVRRIGKAEGVIEVKTECFMDPHSVINSILDYAVSREIDLIVIGTKGRTGLKRFLLGSVASGVVQHAHCPVLLVR